MPERHHCDHRQEHADDHKIEDPSDSPTAASYSFFRIDVFGELDPLRRDLVSPGENERDGEPKHQRDDDQSRSPVGNFEYGKNLGGNLNEQPAHHSIGNGDAVDVAS